MQLSVTPNTRIQPSAEQCLRLGPFMFGGAGRLAVCLSELFRRIYHLVYQFAIRRPNIRVKSNAIKKLAKGAEFELLIQSESNDALCRVGDDPND